jgi:YD repeat-containing protein
MVGSIGRATAFLALCAVWSTGVLAQASATRTSSFAYNPDSGQLTQEVIEPNTSVLRHETNYTHDTFGNQTQASVSGIDIATRTSSTTYDTRGQFAATITNALSQSETWQYDARFGTPTSQTGPNGLTTTWQYDGIGRKTREVRPDGTQTTWAYLFCSGVNGGTQPCPAGATFLARVTPLAANGVTQNGPITTVYFDKLERAFIHDTQGFDASVIRVTQQYDNLGRLQQESRPYSCRAARRS